MKPTISTSLLAWSCTTAGISPSSFEKSIMLRSAFRVPYNKKPRHWSGGAASCRLVRVLALSPSARAVLPDGRMAVAVMVMHAMEAAEH
jgi:hypothetical protein